MKDVFVKVRVTEAERESLKRLAAQHAGGDLSEFIRQAVNDAAAESSDGPPPLRLKHGK